MAHSLLDCNHTCDVRKTNRVWKNCFVYSSRSSTQQGSRRSLFSNNLIKLSNMPLFSDCIFLLNCALLYFLRQYYMPFIISGCFCGEHSHQHGLCCCDSHGKSRLFANLAECGGTTHYSHLHSTTRRRCKGNQKAGSVQQDGRYVVVIKYT